MNIAISPRTLATREIKKYLNNLGVHSTIRSYMTNKKGVYIDIVMEEINPNRNKALLDFIEEIQFKYGIKTVNFKYSVPF